MRHVVLLSLTLPLFLSACQQQRTPPPTAEAQRQQVASVIAGTRYLKQQCGYRDLPADGQIEQAAYRAAHERGWTPSADIAPYSEQLYQRLLRDTTPPASQCAEFSELLKPFIATLPKA